MRRTLPLAALTLLLLATRSQAMFMRPKEVPVDRLVKNLSSYAEKHPKDADAWYALGRVHYLAVAMKTKQVGVFKEGNETEKPRIAANFMQRWLQKPPAGEEPMTAAEIASHLAAAMANLDKAIALDPKNALYALTYASVLEAAPAEAIAAIDRNPPAKPPAEVQAKVEALVKQFEDPSPAVRDAAVKELRAIGAPAVALLSAREPSALPEVNARIASVIKGVWEDRAAEWYAKAFALGAETDLKLPAQPLMGMQEVVSYEAADRYLALTAARGRKPDEVALAEKMTAHKKALDAKPPGPVTPIVFSLEPTATTLRDLLHPTATTPFDLDGTARGWSWSWVKPTTGILVWDPKGTGEITSGRQLFGSVTFGLFWRDGYAALASLDDDRNGELSGPELNGLALWCDRNSNGRSDPGEVTPLEKLGIEALSVRPTAAEPSGELRSDAGVRLRGGKTLPSFDWVSQPAPTLNRPIISSVSAPPAASVAGQPRGS